MNADTVMVVIVAVLMLGYLLYTLLRPEKF